MQVLIAWEHGWHRTHTPRHERSQIGRREGEEAEACLSPSVPATNHAFSFKNERIYNGRKAKCYKEGKHVMSAQARMHAM